MRRLDGECGQLHPGGRDLAGLGNCEIEAPDRERIGRRRQADVDLPAACKTWIWRAVDQPAASSTRHSQTTHRTIECLRDLDRLRRPIICAANVVGELERS